MNFDPFVLPFTIGLIYLVVILSWRYFRWLDELQISDRLKVVKGIFSFRLFFAIRDVFSESLLHRKIFRVNVFLGFMHMSFALFWFLLIVIGSLESKVYAKYPFNAPYDPIFFKFFQHDLTTFKPHGFFNVAMDLLLLLLLIAVLLAVSKKIRSSYFGMKKTTNHRLVDRLARIFLWLIFPLRFLAESTTSGLYANGSFLTGSSGKFMAQFLPLWLMEYPLWWLYSSALGAFFVIMPFSRYMHIPSEVILIFLRRFGIKNQHEIKGFANFEIQSCSSCGICVNICQMSDAAGMKGQQAVYYLQKLRFKRNFEDPVFNCLMCMRCNYFCPVGIDIAHLRTLNREKLMPNLLSDYEYLKQESFLTITPDISQVMYFAGCMTHLKPGIKESVEYIFKNCKVKYSFIDKDGSVCCGKPLFTLGATEEAQTMIEKNRNLFMSDGSKVLITSCPICLKMFKDVYKLDIHVIHHSEFFRLLLDSGRMKLKKSDSTMVYHDPCELGRGLNDFTNARTVLKQVGILLKTPNSKNRSLCCGGSISNLRIRPDQRLKITKDAYQKLTEVSPDVLVTSCPLCEHTFSRVADRKVMDIAEVIAEHMIVAD